MAKLGEAASKTSGGLMSGGPYHIEAGGTLKDLAITQGRPSYNNEAMRHYDIGLYECEIVGNHRMTAAIENNIGLLLLNMGRTNDAEKHLLRSLSYFEALSDIVHPACVKETLARLYVATNQYQLARQNIDDAVQVLEKIHGEAVLAEALTTSGIVLSRLANFSDAKKRFEAAYKVSERCGDREGAKRAMVSMFEEMRNHLDRAELPQICEKLQRLQSFSETSPLTDRVDATIAQIALITTRKSEEVQEPSRHSKHRRAADEASGK
jgi:tetratricopeptide (TPR) repeat protein